VLQKCFEFIAEALKRSKVSTTSNSKLTEMMVELSSIPPSKHETKNEHKMDLLEHSPMHHRKLLSPINQKHQINPNKQGPQ
jgi:hypothetical protein